MFFLLSLSTPSSLSPTPLWLTPILFFHHFPVPCVLFFWLPPPHPHPSPSLSLQWQESPFSLCLVSPTAGCSAGRDVVSTAGRASSLVVGASSQWPLSVWTGTSRSAISAMVCQEMFPGSPKCVLVGFLIWKKKWVNVHNVDPNLAVIPPNGTVIVTIRITNETK